MTDPAEIRSWMATLEMVVADMAESVAQPPILPVPYLPQWGTGADVRRGDCGPACVAMLACFLTEHQPTVDEAATACGQPVTEPGSLSTGHKELIQGAAQYGRVLQTRSRYRPPELDLALLKVQVDKGLPSIALIHYGVLRDYTNSMPGAIKNQDQNYARGHWCVFIGYSEGAVYIHDPDYWTPRANDGNRRAVPERVFVEALKAVAPGCTVGYQGLVVK